jgi:hypothetical protein
MPLHVDLVRNSVTQLVSFFQIMVFLGLSPELRKGVANFQNFRPYSQEPLILTTEKRFMGAVSDSNIVLRVRKSGPL